MTQRIAGSKWVHPFKSVFEARWNRRHYDEVMTGNHGAGNKAFFQSMRRDGGPWLGDQAGSLNAVVHFLRSLGVRWYMPGELGEVVPTRKTITTPRIDETVRPDYAVRSWFYPNYSAIPLEEILWARRLGQNTQREALGSLGHAHGLYRVHGHPQMRRDHPERYSWFRGKRVTDYHNLGHVCFANKELFLETLKFARFMFDHYNEPHASLWPVDGFKQCQCDFCGSMPPSELVWGFVDRVARELYKTHPDRVVSCGAYSPYIHPPKTVEKFTPNVMVVMANRGRPLFDDPVRWESYWGPVEGWREKLAPGHLMRVENNRYGLGRRFPVIHPRMMARDLKALKGICIGEVNELEFKRSRLRSLGYDHLSLYVQTRFLWDADQDVDALLNEYYEKFYGPVAPEMKAALEFAQTAYSRTDGSRPDDGFQKCGCQDKSASDQVWGLIDRVARQLYKTHPDRLVTCVAYATYSDPPEIVDKFTPNVAVLIALCGRASFDDPTPWQAYWRVKARIPVVSYAEGKADPNHYVVGAKPSPEDVWFFNIGRTHWRGDGRQVYGFSPTGSLGYHKVDALAKLVV